MYLGFASAAAVRLRSEGDPSYIFFTHNTYQATFISDILLYYCRNRGYFLETRRGRRQRQTAAATAAGIAGFRFKKTCNQAASSHRKCTTETRRRQRRKCGLGRVLMLYWSCDRIKLIWDILKEKWFQGVATVMHRHFTSSKCKNA